MCTSDMQMVFAAVIKILNIVKFAVPILLIILCTIDLFKLIVSKKDDEIKKLRKNIFMKIVYAVLIYLIPILIPFILNMINDVLPMNYDNRWKECWDYVSEENK